jgi:GNAT superfamily N-acetyltransferase
MRLQTRKLKDGRTTITAYDGRERVGILSVHPWQTQGRRVMQVLQSNVKTGRLRQGIGTKLYEAAAQAACEQGLQLASSPKWMRSAHSSGFWDKQLRKGRAKDIGDGVIVLDQSCGADLSGAPGCTVEEQDTGAKNSLRFDAFCKGAEAGSIRVHKARSKIKGKTVWTVDNVNVGYSFRRQGVATKLYEAAAQAVCRRRGSLASIERDYGAHSMDFWLKQEAKGRARRVPRPREYSKTSRDRYGAADMYDAFILDCAEASDLSGLTACKVEEGANWGDENMMRFSVTCGDDIAGWMDVFKRDDIDGVSGTYWAVNNVYVKDRFQRQGIATRLYEAAARRACEKGVPLASPSRLQGAKSTSFWEKQVRKGRAKRIPRPHRYAPFGSKKRGSEQMDVFVLDCAEASDLSGLDLTRNQKIGLGVGVGALVLLALTGKKTSSNLFTPTVNRITTPPSEIRKALANASRRHGVPLSILLGVAHTESRFNPRAGSSVGAQGLMQLMPGTAASLGVQDPWDAQESAYGGAKFLAALRRQYGSWEKAFAAYNWGQGNVNRNPDPRQWPQATRHYVGNVLRVAEVLG